MLDSPKELLKKLLCLTPIIPIQSKSLAGAVGFKNQYIKKKKKNYPGNSNAKSSLRIRGLDYVPSKTNFFLIEDQFQDIQSKKINNNNKNCFIAPTYSSSNHSLLQSLSQYVQNYFLLIMSFLPLLCVSVIPNSCL